MAINFDVHGYNEQPEQENLQPEAPMGDDTWLQDQFTNKAYDNEETRNAAWAERGLDPNAYEWITDEQGNLYTEGNPVQPQVQEEQVDTQVNPEPNVLVDENDLLTDTDENGSQDIIGAVDDNDLSPNEDETISTETEMEPEPEPDVAPEIPADSVDNTDSSISQDELAQIESEGNKLEGDEWDESHKRPDMKPFGGFSWESNPETRDAVVNTIAESLGVEANDEIKEDISNEPEFTEKVMDAYGIDYHDDLIKSYEKKVKEAHDKVLNFKLAYTGKKEDMLKSRELKKLEEEESKAQKWLDMLRQDQNDDFNGMGWNNGKVDVYDKDAPDYVPSEERPDLGEGSREVLVRELEKEIEQEPDEEKKARKERILRWAGSGVSLSTPNASLNEGLGETSSVRGGNIGNTPSDSERTSRGMGSASKAFHDIMSAPPVSKGQNKMTYENIGQSLSGIHSGSAPRIPDSGKPTSAKASGPTTRMFNDIIKGNSAKPMSYDKTPKGNYSIKGIPTSKKSGGQGEGGGKLGLPRVNANPRIDMIIEKIIAKVKATPNHKIEKGRILIEMEDGKVLIKLGSYRKTSLDNFAKQHPKELEQVYQLIK